MNATEKILIAEETVGRLQSQLGTVETVLKTAEHVAATGEKAGRRLRRFFQVLLFLSVVAAIVTVVKKVVGDRCSTGEEPTLASEAISDTVEPDAADDAPVGGESAPAVDAGNS